MVHDGEARVEVGTPPDSALEVRQKVFCHKPRLVVMVGVVVIGYDSCGEYTETPQEEGNDKRQANYEDAKSFFFQHLW